MKRLVLAVPALLAVAALAGAVGPQPEAAEAQAPAADHPDTVTVLGVGSVESVPDEAQMSFGVETRGETARAAVAANAEAMQKVIAALRQARAREIATQWINVWPVMREENVISGYSASNSVSAVSDIEDAAGLIDAAVAAGANQVSGPGMSRSDGEKLYRGALSKAVADARERAEILVKAAGRTLGEINSISESRATPVPYYDRTALGGAEASTPVVPGQLETTATVSVTFTLR
jgi:hypothetical protein